MTTDAGNDEQPGRLRAIGATAREIGISVRALRYYQEVGLLTPSGRTAGGNRLYADEDLARVRRIRELQQLLGFNLEEIRDVLGREDRLARLRLDYQAASDDGDRLRLLSEARAAYLDLRNAVADKIKRLESFRDELDAKMHRANELRDSLPH
jgi:DNA-binding transcriptional MerR regulator